MKNPKPILASSIFLVLYLTGSVSLKAQNDSRYQTFDFLDFNVRILTEHQINEENVEYLKSAIARELQSGGLTQDPNPDLYVNIGVVVEEEVQTRETDYRDMRYLGQREYHWEVEEVIVGVYKVGTVSVELVDPKADKVVWQESSSNVIRKQKNIQKRINKGVSRIFKKFDVNKLS